jgi:hypothetical protein
VSRHVTSDAYPNLPGQVLNTAPNGSCKASSWSLGKVRLLSYQQTLTGPGGPGPTGVPGLPGGPGGSEGPRLPGSDLHILPEFQNPPMANKPMLRWWWPHGAVDIAEIKAEVNQMYEAGFGGAEIEDVHHSIKVQIDPSGHGWGTTPWLDAVYAASQQAKSVGFQIDMAMGPSYPVSVPNLSPDDLAAGKEMATGRVVVQGGKTYSGPVPEPYKAAEHGVKNKTLIALQAWRVNNGSSPTAVPTILDMDTRVDLKYNVKNDNISFSPSDNGTWIIISFHMRGTGQLAERGPHTATDGAVVDHLSLEGIKASTNYWDRNILTPQLKSAFQSIGGSFFEDSIELEYSTLWTPGFRCEFKRRRGYDLFRFLPAVCQENQKNAFAFTDAEVNRGVINDFWSSMGEMYVDYHAAHMTKWSNSQGMKFRAQVYGLPTDASMASAAIDIPEGESLGFKNLGDYRTLAGAANMKGLRLMSNEACAFAASAYSITLDLCECFSYNFIRMRLTTCK